MNGSIIGTLSEERISEICQENMLNPADEKIVVEIVREIDKDVDDPEKDIALAKEKMKSASDANLILCTIIDITHEFALKKRMLAAGNHVV